MCHCDGSILGLIPELIQMGVTLLNPVQPDAKDMEPERLKSTFGDRLSFHGGEERQYRSSISCHLCNSISS